MVFRGQSFGFPPVMYQGPLFMSCGRYFMGFCLVFLGVMCLWGYCYSIVFRRLSFGFHPIIDKGLLLMSYCCYIAGFCLVFLPFMYVGAVYLSFGWYSIGSFILLTCVLQFGYCQADFITLHVYRISSVPILSYCYPMACVSLPGTCEAHQVERIA
jgi:hypothetical protein